MSEPMYGLERYLLQLRFMLIVIQFINEKGGPINNVALPLKDDLLQEIINVEYRLANPHRGF